MTHDPNPVPVPAGAKEITGKSGKVYRRADTLSFKRYGVMERLNVELAYGRTVQETFAAQKKAYELLDKQKLADAAVAIHNSMMGIARVADGGIHPAASLCMLFWNAQGEDVGDVTDELLASKVEDVSHLDAAFFFGEAVSSVPGLLAAYKELSTSSTVSEAPKPGQYQNSSSPQPVASAPSE